MKYIYALIYFVLIISLLSLWSCDRDKQMYVEQMNRASSITNSHPDSTLMILDSIDISELNESLLNQYNLLYVQAKDKAYRDITSDTVVFAVKKYYLSKNDLAPLGLATYYCGRVLQEQRNYKDAMNEYLEAGKYAETNGDNLNGLLMDKIGDVFQKQLNPSQATKYYFLAIKYYIKAKNKRNEIGMYNAIGNTYLMRSKVDSAFYYYQKGLDLAKATTYYEQIANLNMCIGVAYRERGDYDLAIHYFRESNRVSYNRSHKSKILLNIAKTYHLINQQDSAQLYIDESLELAIKDNDLSTLTSLYQTLSRIEESKANDKQALSYYKEYTDALRKIYDENENKDILELQKKYKYEQFQSENESLRIQQQQLMLIIAACIFVCFLLAFLFYKNNVQKKKIALEKENEILEAENKIFQLVGMSQQYDEKEKSIRNILLHHFDILSKAATLEQYVKSDNQQDMRLVKKFNEIVYGQASLQWDVLYSTMNELHNQLFERLKAKYPILDEVEFQICCLTYAGFSCVETGIIVGLSANTIQMKRTAIRKKLGIVAGGNIQEFLDENL